MYQHLANCSQYAEYLQFYALPDTDAVNAIVNQDIHLQNFVTENTEIIDHNDHNDPFSILKSLLYQNNDR